MNIIGRLLHALSPVHIGVIEIPNAPGGSSGDFIEVGNVVWKSSKRTASLQTHKKNQQSDARRFVPEAHYDSAPPNKQQREHGQEISHSKIVCSDRHHSEISKDGSQNENLAGGIDESFYREMNPCQCCCE